MGVIIPQTPGLARALGLEPDCACMKNSAANTDSSQHQRIGLQRWGLVSPVQELLRQHGPLSAALEQVASTCPYPSEESPRSFVAKRTLEDWSYRFLHGGLPALQPKARSDRGRPRRLSPTQQQWVLAQVRADPGIAVKTLYRQWKKSDPAWPALSALYRWLEHNDLDVQGRRSLLRQSVRGPTKAFETPAVNERWMADFSPGPFGAISPKALATPLCLLLDDHSRLVTFAAYGWAADTQAFLSCLQQAVRRRGLPRKLDTDNGGPFINDHLKIVCANLGIRLRHAKPYHAWSKGQCERIFRTIPSDFEATLRLPGQGAAGLEEVRLLLGLNLPTHPTFARVLLGDEYLLGQWQLRNHRALSWRLSAHFTLGPWTEAQIQQYLQRGLETVGINRTVLEPAAVDRLIRASSGVPRSVCLMARAAWLAAATAGAQTDVGALKLSNLLQLDRFEEDLNISRVRLHAASIPPSPPAGLATLSPAQQQAGRERALKLLHELRRQHGV